MKPFILAASLLCAAAQAAPSFAHETHPGLTISTTKTYRNIRGQVIAIERPKAAGEKYGITVDHEAIPGLMPAMRMMLPLQNNADVKKLKKGAKIRFDLVLRGGLFITNIHPLPAKTKLKLGH